MHVLIVEDKPYLAEAVRDGLRLEAVAADIAGDEYHFTNAVHITVSALRERLGEPWIIATVPGVGNRIDTGMHTVAPGSTYA